MSTTIIPRRDLLKEPQPQLSPHVIPFKRSECFNICMIDMAEKELGFSQLDYRLINDDGFFCLPINAYLSRRSRYGFVAGRIANAEIIDYGTHRMLSGSVELADGCLIPLSDIIHNGTFEITFVKTVRYVSHDELWGPTLSGELCWYPKTKLLID